MLKIYWGIFFGLHLCPLIQIRLNSFAIFFPPEKKIRKLCLVCNLLLSIQQSVQRYLLFTFLFHFSGDIISTCCRFLYFVFVISNCISLWSIGKKIHMIAMVMGRFLFLIFANQKKPAHILNLQYIERDCQTVLKLQGEHGKGSHNIFNFSYPYDNLLKLVLQLFFFNFTSIRFPGATCCRPEKSGYLVTILIT